MRNTIILLASLFVSLNLFSQNVGIGVPNPSDKLHINAGIGQNPLLVQINNSTKMRVWANGGTSIGVPTTPPVDGLLVDGTIQPMSNISTPAKMIIESTTDSIIINAGGSKVIIAANGNITIKGSASSTINIESGSDLDIKSGGNLSIKANGVLDLNGTAGVNLTSSNLVSVTGTTINQTASGTMSLLGGLIKLNNGATPAARIGSVVSVTGNVGTIVTGSPTVLIN